MRSPRPIIGIIGGMGPQAGFDLAARITSKTKVGCDQDHFSIIVLSYPSAIDDRTDYLEGRTGKNPASAIMTLVDELERLGACASAIACNTAHAPAILDPVLAHIRNRGFELELKHLIKETVRAVRRTNKPGSHIGILGTAATFKLGLYEDALRSEGLIPVLPDEEVRSRHVFPAIYDPESGIKVQSGPVTPEAREHVLRAVVHLAEKGAEQVILGCTELPLAAPASASELQAFPVPLVDPAEIMADCLIQTATAARRPNL